MGEVPAEAPLSDIRVIEIGYGIAAPIACRSLAEFGADVIRVESERRPDSLRTMGAGWLPLGVDNEIRRDTTIGFGFTCPGKRSVGLEIDGTSGQRAFHALIANSDVLVMNMGVEAVEHLHLRYEDLRQVNPRLIYLNMPSFGSAAGPYRTYRTWGSNLSGLAGVTMLAGWPDREPTGIPLSFPDYPSGHWAVIAVLSAILRRDVTGLGCEIDLSQFQVAMACIGPSLTEAAITGTAPQSTGARLPGRAPTGVYPTRETERWVALSVIDEPMWHALCSVEGLELLGLETELDTVEDRLAAHDDLDRVLSRWTSRRTAWEAATELQRAGVAAHPVFDQWDVLADPQLEAREFFRILPSRRFGAELTYGQAVVLSETPAHHERAAPAFGEHTRHVLREVAGLEDDEIESMIVSGEAHEMSQPDLRLERPFLGWIRNIMRLPWPDASVSTADVLYQRYANELLADE